MHVPWEHARCIVCLEERPLTLEHIIPQIIGGKLQASFLCADCNSRFGTEVDSRLRTGSRIRRALLELRGTLPGLVESFERGAPYTAQTVGGEFRGTVRGGNFRADPTRAADGSQLLPNPEARRAIVNILRRDGREAEIPEALAAFDASPVNQRVEVAPGLAIIDWQTEGIRPVFDEAGSLPDSWALKTAYEFLACCIGGAIYEDPFEAYRRLLRGEPWDPALAAVELLDAGHLAPMHGILLEENNPYTIVQIRLFRRVCYRTHFRRIAVSGPRFFYEQVLSPPNEVFARLESESTPS